VTGARAPCQTRQPTEGRGSGGGPIFPSFTQIGQLMNIVLWVLQAVLAAVFLSAGLPKIAKPKEELVASMGEWVNSFPAPGVKLLGLVEVLGAIGLIVPPLVGVAPVLSPVAAVGIVVIMVGAIVAHARESAGSKIAMNVVLGVLAVVVAWGRFGPYAF
jgi:uncharacterized membrane protein YphA (DoxX/SURF4 family)